MQIYPSILELSIDAFEAKMSLVLPHFTHIQIDITDGIFVPNKTVQIEELENGGWRMEDGKTFEFHLMARDYKTEIEKLEKLKEKINITSVLIHLGAIVRDPHAPLDGAQDDKGRALRLTQNDVGGWKYGIVLNPEDSVTDNWELIKQFDIVQLMTVHPGQQGSPFVPEALSKIGELRELGFTGKIILDGAMNDKTLEVVLQQKYLPDAICPGSYFSVDISNRLHVLEQMLLH